MNRYITPVTIITGATGSIGSSLSYKLANKGEAIVLACRDIKKADSLRNEIISATGNRSVFSHQISLDDFRSITQFAGNINESYNIKSIIHNAGIINRYYKTSADGFEHTLTVNYLGPVLLTRLLLPNIQDNGNIIFTTSLTRKLSKINQDYLFESPEKFSQLKTYGKSKLAIAHYALNLSKELGARRINVNCTDPGVVNSNMITMNRWFDPLANIFFRPFIRNSDQGAEPALLALSSGLTGMVFTSKKKSALPTSWFSNTNHNNLISHTDKIVNDFIKQLKDK